MDATDYRTARQMRYDTVCCTVLACLLVGVMGGALLF
jgi:hypothetical protein